MVRNPFPAALLLLAIACVTATGCSRSNADTATDGSSRFLLSSPDGLAELTLDGRQTILNFDDGSFIFAPAVSQDGQRYAFARQPPVTRSADGTIDFGSDLYLVDSDGSNQREVLHHGSVGEFIRDPVFLPNGSDLLISIRGRDEASLPDSRIERLNIETGERTRLFDEAIEPALSPDGATLAFVELDPGTLAQSLVVADLASGARRTLVPAEGDLTLFSGLAWSPDGEMIAFAASDVTTATATRSGTSTSWLSATTHPTLQDVWLINADGTDLRRLAEIVELRPSPAWSEDGSHLFVLTETRLLQLDPAGDEMVRLGDGVPSGQIRLLRR